MESRILGPLEVRAEQGPLSLGRIKPRAVLAVLLLNANEPVSAERLALALWGEDAPTGAVKTVQVHVSRLRKVLGDEQALVTTPGGYCLRVGREGLVATSLISSALSAWWSRGMRRWRPAKPSERQRCCAMR